MNSIMYLCWTTEKLPGLEKPHGKTVAWCHDMERHAQKCVKRYYELANKKTEQLYKVSSPSWMIINSDKEEPEKMENYQMYVHKTS